MITKCRLQELLDYDLESGVFTWRISRGRCKVGSEAGYMSPDGYIYMRVDGKLHLAHRLAWLYVHGNWPKREIDHINGEEADNRIANLREATHAENLRNRGVYKSNTSGFKGVSWHKASGKWRADIKLDGKKKSLGYFGTPEEAYTAYCEVGKKMHGKFFNDGTE